jgi:hypothetical protein
MSQRPMRRNRCRRRTDGLTQKKPDRPTKETALQKSGGSSVILEYASKHASTMQAAQTPSGTARSEFTDARVTSGCRTCTADKSRPRQRLRFLTRCRGCA